MVDSNSIDEMSIVDGAESSNMIYTTLILSNEPDFLLSIESLGPRTM